MRVERGAMPMAVTTLDHGPGSPALMPLDAGQSLSHYMILDPLGAGGMGEAYRTNDTQLGREVAIKVLSEEFADDEERVRRFEREAMTLASLNHPNVAGIHGVGQEGETYFLALELVPGEERWSIRRAGRGGCSEESGAEKQRIVTGRPERGWGRLHAPAVLGSASNGHDGGGRGFEVLTVGLTAWRG